MSEPATPHTTPCADATSDGATLDAPERALPDVVVGLRAAAISYAESRRVWLAEGDPARIPILAEQLAAAERTLQESAVRFAIPGADAHLLVEGFVLDTEQIVALASDAPSALDAGPLEQAFESEEITAVDSPAAIAREALSNANLDELMHAARCVKCGVAVVGDEGMWCVACGMGSP